MMRRGIVVEVHPEDHSVDLVMADDGSRLVGVQVMTPNGSTRSGFVDLPEIPKRKDKWDITTQTGQDMLAIVGFVGQHPVVTGFLFPQVSQMTHTDPKLRMDRHQSDVIQTIDGEGNVQLAHPSGWFLRIGTEPEKVDHTDKNVDQNLKVDRNTATRPYVRLQMAGSTAVLTIDPDGNITVTNKGNTSVTTDGTTHIHSNGNMTLSSDTHIQMTAPRIDLN